MPMEVCGSATQAGLWLAPEYQVSPSLVAVVIWRRIMVWPMLRTTTQAKSPAATMRSPVNTRMPGVAASAVKGVQAVMSANGVAALASVAHTCSSNWSIWVRFIFTCVMRSDWLPIGIRLATHRLVW